MSLLNSSADPSAHPRVLMGADAAQALTSMGLTAELLTTACVEGLRAANSQHDPYEPAISLGFQRWSKIVGALRAALTRENEGWRMHDRFNAPRSVSPDGSVAIAAIGGDSRTGDAHHEPANVRARGRVFSNEVAANAMNSAASSRRSGVQAVFDLGFPDSAGIDDWAGPATRTWILLYYWDPGVHVLRTELSLPSSCQDGVVDAWERRILLPEISLDEANAAEVQQWSGTAPSDDVDFEITAIGR